MEDKKKICKDCHQEFILEAGKVEWFKKHPDLTEPVRCQACIDKRRQERNR